MSIAPSNIEIPWWKTSFDHGEAEAAAECIRNRNLSQGPVVREFEVALQAYLGVSDVIAVTSGSDALVLSLLASGIRPGDEVLVPKRSWIATAHAVHILGAIPVFVETLRDRPIIDLDDAKRRITQGTRAIIAVHVNGRAAPMDSLNALCADNGLKLIEDAAQALGSTDEQHRLLGTMSQAGCFSLSVAKVISTGQGGFIATNDASFAGRLRDMRTHGVESTHEPQAWSMPGFNFRMTDVLASIGLVQLRQLPERLRRLRAIYERYSEGLASLESVRIIPLEEWEIGPYIESMASDREGLQEFLLARGIETRRFYPDQDGAKYWTTTPETGFSRAFQDEGLYLPSGPSLSDSEVDRVIREIHAYEGHA